MESLVCHLIDKDDAVIAEVERLRGDVFHVSGGEYFTRAIRDGKIVVLGCFLQNELVGGAYLSSTYQSLFIESIFVRKEYQRHSLHVGSFMFRYILEHKDIFEKIFHTSFYQCRLESSNQDSFYQN